MAGAFGYEKAHYELSMNIGELRLFGAVREKPPGSFTLSTAGFSCRHQLEHATGVQPKHPIEVLQGGANANLNVTHRRKIYV